jgi:hypothetical protein
MSNKGLLIVLMQPPPAFEEEFNAWYDTEHVPERLAVPGFLTGRRFVSVAAVPRYMALYDLDRIEVLDSPEYAAVSGDRFSPWTRRVTGRVRVQRSAGTQIYPGSGVTGRAARQLVIRFRDGDAATAAAIVDGMRSAFERRPNVSQVRVFSCPAGDKIDYFGVVEARDVISDQVDTSVFGEAAGLIDLINVYANY